MMRILSGLTALALGVVVLSATACGADEPGAAVVEAADARTFEVAEVAEDTEVAVEDGAAAQDAATTVRKFIAVEGATLKEKMETATRRGRAEVTGEGRFFWTAYTFDVRPGVGVDVDFKNGRGSTFIGGIGFTLDARYETREVGVFLLRRAGDGSIAETRVYNLARRREFGGHPVYWLGRAGNDESLAFLNELALTATTNKVAEHAAMSIVIHDDARVASILKDLIRRSSNQRVRAESALWLGHFSEEVSFLAELARNNNEQEEVRAHAVLGIGANRKAASTLDLLRGIYDSTSNRKVREHVFIVLASGDEVDEGDAATRILIDIADREKDDHDRKQAIFWLGQKAGQRSLRYLGDVVERSDGETEIQKQAVFALSQKPRDESVPTLIRIARTHPKGEVRKQAIFWLGQIDDQRALQFFKEILTN